MSARRLVLACAYLAAGCGGGDEPPSVGTLERDRIELVAEVDEPLVELAVREGESVPAGALIARLDDTRAQLVLQRAAARRDETQAQLAELERGPRHERVREARARWLGAEGALATANAAFARAQSLEERALESAAVRDETRAARDRARAGRDEARANLDALERGSTDEELARARAALAASVAELHDAELSLARLSVYAPRAARVDALPFELGERPARGAVLAVLLDEGPPYARVHVPQAVHVRLAPGARARVRIAGVEGELGGHLRRLSSEPAFTPYYALTEHDRGRLSYLAEIELDDPRALAFSAGAPLEVRFEPSELARGD